MIVVSEDKLFDIRPFDKEHFDTLDENQKSEYIESLNGTEAKNGAVLKWLKREVGAGRYPPKRPQLKPAPERPAPERVKTSVVWYIVAAAVVVYWLSSYL